MKKFTLLTILLIMLVFTSGCFALSEPEESSGAVEAPTLAASDEAPLADTEVTQEAAAPTEESASAEENVAEAVEPDAAGAYPAEETAALPEEQQMDEAYPAGETAVEPAVEALPQEYPSEKAYPADTEATSDEESTSDAVQAGTDLPIYEIDPGRSEARFSINEVLRGEPVTVVGRSSNLGGQIGLDLAYPATAQIGDILVNARDFATDNEFRNRAIANEILLTNEYEYITFEPTAVSGLPQTAEIGQTYAIQITGILGITDATQEVTFDAQITPVSETEIAGLAAVEILYDDFGLSIPFSQSVESVEDNVLLELDFVATRAG